MCRQRAERKSQSLPYSDATAWLGLLLGRYERHSNGSDWAQSCRSAQRSGASLIRKQLGRLVDSP
jgi:hypothetical protein